MTADTPRAVEAALADLTEGEKNWAAQSLTRRAELLDEVRTRTAAHAQQWVDAALAFKRTDPASPLVGEEWMSGPYAFAAAAGLLGHSVAELAAGRSPLRDAHFGTASGHTTVRVLPAAPFDSLLLSGFSADVWLRPGVDRTAAVAAAGLAQRDPTHTGGVGVVLGAGNITSIAPLDVLCELFAHNRVVALKLNPLTDPMLPVLTEVLRPFVDLGAVRVLTGGADIGELLVRDDRVAHVHMTGSALTHDAIVWGVGPEAAERKAAGTPRLAKPMSSELGGVSPTIVVPGPWSDADLAFQAEHVATQRLHNGGYNCVAAQGVIVSADWAQKDQFLAALRRAMDAAPQRPAYYPGSDARVDDARASYPAAAVLGKSGERTLVTGLAPTAAEALLCTEYFAPVLGVVEIPGTGAEFTATAATVANREFTGTLGVNVIAHPATVKTLGPAFERLVADLRYGTVAVNAWTGVGFLAPGATWGAYPGHTIADVQSGIGVVHNAFLIADTERTVVRGPFRPSPRSLLHGELSLSPKPPWFVGNKTAAETGKRLAAFAGDPGWSRLPGIFAAALRG